MEVPADPAGDSRGIASQESRCKHCGFKPQAEGARVCPQCRLAQRGWRHIYLDHRLGFVTSLLIIGLSAVSLLFTYQKAGDAQQASAQATKALQEVTRVEGEVKTMLAQMQALLAKVQILAEDLRQSADFQMRADEIAAWGSQALGQDSRRAYDKLRHVAGNESELPAIRALAREKVAIVQQTYTYGSWARDTEERASRVATPSIGLNQCEMIKELGKEGNPQLREAIVKWLIWQIDQYGYRARSDQAENALLDVVRKDSSLRVASTALMRLGNMYLYDAYTPRKSGGVLTAIDFDGFLRWWQTAKKLPQPGRPKTCREQ